VTPEPELTYDAAVWTHVRYTGSISFAPGPSEAVEVAIQLPDRGDEARLLSSRIGQARERSASRVMSEAPSVRAHDKQG
jgi:hypothetical protein